MKNCPHCSTHLNVDALVCWNCGHVDQADQIEEDINTEPKRENHEDHPAIRPVPVRHTGRRA